MRYRSLLCVSIVLTIISGSAEASDLAVVISDCEGCHGDDGISQWSDVPTIAGMPEFVHSDALYIYRDNERPCAESKYRQGDTERAPTTMCEVVADLSDETIDALAAHYFGLPFAPAKQPFDAALAAAGRAVHDEHCEKCHSDGGSNPDDEAGILAGQWMPYMEKTFAEYESGDRDQPNKMKDKMELLSAEDVTALLNFYASQQ